MLYKYKEDVFASDANSTAYKYPMTDAQILESEHSNNLLATSCQVAVELLLTEAPPFVCPVDSGPAVEVSFDGTVRILVGHAARLCAQSPRRSAATLGVNSSICLRSMISLPAKS
jgi:hypothetical protein